MVCKENVIAWFKEAASHRRLDLMCSLLNMCIPFELRFLGTYIEEQGKHDYQELRGAEITANGMDKLTKELSVSKGILEKCTRHRLTIYISLLHSYNYTCANWIFNALLRNEALDLFVASGNFTKDPNLHSELLLLYTIALNHPVFTFNQKLYIREIVAKLSEAENAHHAQSTPQNTPPACPPGMTYTIKPPPMPVHHMPIGVAKGPSPLQHTEPPMPPPGLPLPPVEFVPGPQPMWPRQPPFTCPLPDLSYPPPISPLVSQQSSPTASRSVSPTRMYPCRPHVPVPVPPMTPIVAAHIDRLPPPPPLAHKESLVLTSPPQYNTDLKTIPIDELSRQDGSIILAGKLENGLIANMAALSTGKCQPMYPLGELQSLSLDGDREPHLTSLRCTSSSGSSNCSDTHSPPATPTDSIVLPHGPGRGVHCRNGGGACASTSSVPPNTSVPPPTLSIPPPPSSASSNNPATTLYTNNCTVPYSTHYPVAPPPTTTFHNRSLFYSQAYRPQFTAYQQNGGELPYLFQSHYIPMIYSSATTIPQPKITCYNCGQSTHLGSECKEQNIEDITQKTGYQLEFNQSDIPPADKQ